MRGKEQIEAASKEANSIFHPMVSGARMADIHALYYDYHAAVLTGSSEATRRMLGRLIRTAASVAGVSVHEAMLEAQKAAQRNEHKGDWRRWPLGRLFHKLDEEMREFGEARDPERIKEELGDVIWVAIMIADHGLMLDLEEAS